MDVKAFIEHEELPFTWEDVERELTIEELSSMSGQDVLSILRWKFKWHGGGVHPSFLEAYEKPFSHPLRFPIKTERLNEVLRKGRENVYSRTNVPKPKIAFIGRSNAGKSTMINSFLGVKLLPATWNPTTSAILYVKHKEDRPAFVEDNVCFFKKGDGVNEWDEQKLSNEAHYHKWLLESGDIELITDMGTHLGNNDSAQIGAAVVFVDYPLLKGCDLLDTPGPTMGMEKDIENSARAAQLADAIVYLYPANASFLEEDISAIQGILAKRGSFKTSLPYLFLVASQVDTLSNTSAEKVFDYEQTSLDILDSACERLYNEAVLQPITNIIEKTLKIGDKVYTTVEYGLHFSRYEKIWRWGGLKESSVMPGKTAMLFTNSVAGLTSTKEVLLEREVASIDWGENSPITEAVARLYVEKDDLRKHFFSYSTKLRFGGRTNFEKNLETFLHDEAEKRNDNPQIGFFCDCFLYPEYIESDTCEEAWGKKPIIVKCQRWDEEKIFIRMARQAFIAGERVLVLCLLQDEYPTIVEWLKKALQTKDEDGTTFDPEQWYTNFGVTTLETPPSEMEYDKIIIPKFWRDGMPDESLFSPPECDEEFCENGEYENAGYGGVSLYEEDEGDFEIEEDNSWDDYSDADSACNENNFGDGYSRQSGSYEINGGNFQEYIYAGEEDEIEVEDKAFYLRERLYNYMVSAKESLCITYWGIPHSFIKDFKWGTYSYVDSNKNKLDENGRIIKILLPW